MGLLSLSNTASMIVMKNFLKVSQKQKAMKFRLKLFSLFYERLRFCFINGGAIGY